MYKIGVDALPGHFFSSLRYAILSDEVPDNFQGATKFKSGNNVGKQYLSKEDSIGIIYRDADEMITGFGIIPTSVIEEMVNDGKQTTYEELVEIAKSNEKIELEEEPKEKKLTKSDELIKLATSAIYFHTPDKIAYADVTINGNRHTYAVNSKNFKLWLSGESYKKNERGASSQDLKDALCTLEAKAIHDGETRDVYLRIAEFEQKIYIDLGTDDWKAIEVDANGWNIINNPPVRFRRPNTLLPLPIPVEGGNLSELKDLLNIDGNDWSLLITFMLNCYRPSLTYPVLILNAVRGSGKTTTAEIVKDLTDPAKAGLIKLIGDTQKLMVATNNRHLIVYDNVSNISADESDNLCMVATGMGYSTRTLHTNDEETIFQVVRPQVITSIDALVTRGDLASRSLMVNLPEIPDSMRMTKATLNAKLEDAKPRIFGALMTALSQTLAALPDLEAIEEELDLKRMADFTLFGMAAEKALGLAEGDFTKAYSESSERGRQGTVEASPLGEAILEMANFKSSKPANGWIVKGGESRAELWKGTASELLAALGTYADDSIYRSRFFPKSANALSRQLNRIAPDLRSMGIDIEHIREGQERTRMLVIYKVVKVSSLSSAKGDRELGLSNHNTLKADDKADDKRTIKGLADDTFLADDKRTMRTIRTILLQL